MIQDTVWEDIANVSVKNTFLGAVTCEAIELEEGQFDFRDLGTTFVTPLSGSDHSRMVSFLARIEHTHISPLLTHVRLRQECRPTYPPGSRQTPNSSRACRSTTRKADSRRQTLSLYSITSAGNLTREPSHN